VEKDIWWRKLPNWWVAVDEAAAKTKSEEEEKKKKQDWWTSSSYKGKPFLPLSTASDKVVSVVYLVFRCSSLTLCVSSFFCSLFVLGFLKSLRERFNEILYFYLVITIKRKT
jgi:hypothetical protein